MCHPANNQCRGWLSWSHDIAHLKRRCWAAIQTASVAAAGSVLVALLAALLLLPHSGAPLFTPSILAAFVAPRLSWLRISSLHIGNTGGHKNAASPQRWMLRVVVFGFLPADPFSCGGSALQSPCTLQLVTCFRASGSGGKKASMAFRCAEPTLAAADENICRTCNAVKPTA